MELFETVTTWLHLALVIASLIIAIVLPRVRGKGWLVASLSMSTVAYLFYPIVNLIFKTFENYDLYDWVLPAVLALKVIGLLAPLFMVIGLFRLVSGLNLLNSGIKSSSESIDSSSDTVAPHRATLILVLGILGLVVCAPLAIAAWLMGSNDMSRMRSGQMDATGLGMTTAGYVLGIIGTILFGIGLVGAILWLTVFADVAGSVY